MKKFKIVFALLIGLLAFNMQYSTAQVTLPADQYLFDYTGVATDTVGTGTTTWSKEIIVNKPQMLYYNNQLKVTKVSGSPRATIKLQGKLFSTDAYTDITTTSYYGTTADTTINYTQVTTKQAYRYYRQLITATAGKTKVTWLKASFKY